MGLLEQLFDTGDSGIEDIGDVLRPFVFVGPAFGDFENPGFGEVEQIFAGSPLWVEAGFGDLVGHRNHFAHHRAFAHDVGIGADVSRAGRIFGQFSQIGEAAHAVQLPLTLQRLGERNQVNRAAGLLQARHLGKNMTVRTGIKVVGNDAFGDVVPALVIQH